jgi:hypothetical protein
MTNDSDRRPWTELLDHVRETHPEVVSGAMFGMPCAKAGGKAFMGWYDDGVVFKLDQEPRERALELPGAHLFEPMAGRPMREWVVVPAEHDQSWPQLAEEALTKIRAR